MLPQSIALLVLALLVFWLVLDSPPTETRWKAIAAEFERGTIGKLPADESALLRKTVDWLVPYAGIEGKIIVNERPQPGYLHVYTTTPEALTITGCAQGNAVYDSLLNAIFIDENILRPEEITLLGESGRRTMLSLRDLTLVIIP